LFEKQQTDLSHRFGQRVLELEAVISRLLRNIAHLSSSQAAQKSFITLQSVPGIAHHLGSATANQPPFPERDGGNALKRIFFSICSNF